MEGALVEAFEALRRRDAEGALRALDGFVSADPALAARSASYRAQALRALARVEEAERAAAEAVRLAKAAGDPDAVTALRQLHASILASVAAMRTAERRHTGDTSDVSRVLSLAGEGRPDEALALARVIRERARAAGDAREEVLALLACARVADAEPWIAEAHAVADASDDMNLVTAVAQAARAAGVRLAPPRFG
ncbi:MAG: hypothetical protein ACOZNI_04515 [Myxococcota bacterium]